MRSKTETNLVLALWGRERRTGRGLLAFRPISALPVMCLPPWRPVAEGAPAIGLSPCGAWVTCNRQVGAAPSSVAVHCEPLGRSVCLHRPRPSDASCQQRGPLHCTASRAQVVEDGCGAVAAALRAGLLPVIHGDAVFDTQLGCTILGGDPLTARLCQVFRPECAVFLVGGVFVGVRRARRAGLGPGSCN